MNVLNNKKAMKAIYLGTLCSVAYLAVYFARNILGAVTPQMLESGEFTEQYIGKASSIYFVVYAVGQLINGRIGDRVKAKHMISFGLLMAGIANLLFSKVSVISPQIALIFYGITGFFLAMIYAPMTKVVAENVEPLYAPRCSLGYTFASFLGSPAAGMAASFLAWQSVFFVSSIILALMAVVVFAFFTGFERKGLVKYNQYKVEKQNGGGLKSLFEYKIVKFTFISIITGVVRTTVIFWLPTYLTQHLGFSAEKSAMLFTVATSITSFSVVTAVFVHGLFKRDLERSMLLMFSLAAVLFGVLYFIKNPILNVICIVAAIMSSNTSGSLLWSMYCPSLRDTGMVSSATGFLDFASYMAAAASSTLFANAVTKIGWGNLILVWCGLMIFGVVISYPFGKPLPKPNLLKYNIDE